MNNSFSIYNKDIHHYPLVISMPHSGTQLTQKMKANLLDNVVLANMDWYIPLVYDFFKRNEYYYHRKSYVTLCY